MAIELAGPQLENTGNAGVIARPPLIFLATLIFGFVMDHLVPLGFPISRIGLAHWINVTIAGAMVLIGLALATAGRKICGGLDARVGRAFSLTCGVWPRSQRRAWPRLSDLVCVLARGNASS